MSVPLGGELLSASDALVFTSGIWYSLNIHLLSVGSVKISLFHSLCLFFSCLTRIIRLYIGFNLLIFAKKHLFIS